MYVCHNFWSQEARKIEEYNATSIFVMTNLKVSTKGDDDNKY